MRFSKHGQVLVYLHEDEVSSKVPYLFHRSHEIDRAGKVHQQNE